MSDAAPNALSSVLQSAKQLNQASEAANTVITTIQLQLIEANFGIEYWFYSDALETSFNEQGEEEHVVPGFYKHHSAGWCLATKYCSQGTDENGSHVKSWDWTPLLKASRDTRLEALRIMPEFLAGLDKRIRRATEQIETAVKRAARVNGEK